MNVVIGTAGHIDHGKTTLVKALTGIDADRLPEEKKRGITIDIGFAELDTGDVLDAYRGAAGRGRLRTSADFQASAAANPQLEALP